MVSTDKTTLMDGVKIACKICGVDCDGWDCWVIGDDYAHLNAPNGSVLCDECFRRINAPQAKDYLQ